MTESIPTNLLREQKALVEERELMSGQEQFYRIWQDYTSPYSHKVMSYMNYKSIPYKRMQVTMDVYMGEIVELVGQSIIPVILTPDDRVMQDSTPILEWFELQHKMKPAIPEDKTLAFVMWLLEEFADEYMPRIHMHTRWGNEQNRNTLSHRLARGLTFGSTDVSPKDIAPFILERQSGFGKHLGLSADDVLDNMDKQILELLGILERHFENHQFLLGFKPSLADFSLYGTLRIHLFNDPQSNEIMELNAPRTCRWMDTITEFGDVRGCVGQTQFGDWTDVRDGLPETLSELLGFVAKTYIPFAQACAIASREKQKSFEAKVDGIVAIFSTHQYRVWSFEQLQLRFQSLAQDDKATVERVLVDTGVFPTLMDHEIIHNGLFDGFTPPFVKDGASDSRIRYMKQKAQSQA